MTTEYNMFINGKSVPSASGEYFDSENPADGSVFARIAKGTRADVDSAVRAAHAAAESWGTMNPHARGQIVHRLYQVIMDNMDHFASLESGEMGLPDQFGGMIVPNSAEFFTYYGGLAPSILGETVPVSEDKFIYNLYEPFGVVGIITPWNVPLNQAARSIAPALAAGNTVVVKPSEYTSTTAIELARLASEAGLPDGVLNVVTGFGHDVGAAVAEHPLVEKLFFTGSVPTGQAVGAIAAEKIMPVTLELGGKSANIIFEDANLEAAAPTAMMGFALNTGQACTAGSRVLVQRSIYEKFSKMLVVATESLSIGMEKDFPTIGPIANRMQFEKVLGFFESAKQEGATALTGGERVTGEGFDDGYYVKPTVYADVTPDMRVVREEVFGPVSVLIPFDTEEEAIEIANSTEFGLAAGIWTENVNRAHKVAAKLKAGTVYVNTYQDISIEAPMGGYKKSGIGREKGVAALKEYLQQKNVTIQLS